MILYQGGRLGAAGPHQEHLPQPPESPGGCRGSSAHQRGPEHPTLSETLLPVEPNRKMPLPGTLPGSTALPGVSHGRSTAHASADPGSSRAGPARGETPATSPASPQLVTGSPLPPPWSAWGWQGERSSIPLHPRAPGTTQPLRAPQQSPLPSALLVSPLY